MKEGNKAFWKSKTLWINLLAIVGLLATEIAETLGVGGTVTIVAVLNMIVRFFTTKGIDFKLID